MSPARRALPILATAAAASVLPLSVTASSAPRSPDVRRTLGWIESMAMDGSRLAYDVQAHAPRSCNHVDVWNVATGRVVRVSGKRTCAADSTSTGAGVRELAVAGSHVAWIVNTGGNTESSDTLFTASLAGRRERRLATADRRGDVDCVLTGRSLGGLVGDGALLAYNVWTMAADTSGGDSCATRDTSGALRRIAGSTTSVVRSGLDTLTARDANRGRIAVLRNDGTVAVFSQRGLVQRTFAPHAAKEIALSGDRLVVLTRSRTIELFDTNTGALAGTRAVPGRAGAAHLDAAGGVAAYATGTKLHALRLTTRKDVVIATARRSIVDVAVEPAGIAYAYNTFTQRGRTFRDIGTVVFVSMARVRRALS
jgi:hypothetical protein